MHTSASRGKSENAHRFSSRALSGKRTPAHLSASISYPTYDSYSPCCANRPSPAPRSTTLPTPPGRRRRTCLQVASTIFAGVSTWHRFRYDETLALSPQSPVKPVTGRTPSDPTPPVGGSLAASVSLSSYIMSVRVDVAVRWASRPALVSDSVLLRFLGDAIEFVPRTSCHNPTYPIRCRVNYAPSSTRAVMPRPSDPCLAQGRRARRLRAGGGVCR